MGSGKAIATLNSLRGDTYYLCRQVGNTYELTKFTSDANEPEVTYRITPRGYCNCPSRVRPCKHIGVLESFLAAQRSGLGLHTLAYDLDFGSLCKIALDVDTDTNNDERSI